MSRLALVFDRFVVFVFGVVLVAAGAAVAAQSFGWADVFDEPVRISWHDRFTDFEWWPWAALGAGVVAVVLALRWLSAHAHRRGLGSLTLPSSGRTGRSTVDASALIDAAADVLAETLGVKSASGRLLKDRRQLVVAMSLTTDGSADLERIRLAAQQVSGDLRNALGRDDVHCRFEVVAARRTQ